MKTVPSLVLRTRAVIKKIYNQRKDNYGVCNLTIHNYIQILIYLTRTSSCMTARNIPSAAYPVHVVCCLDGGEVGGVLVLAGGGGGSGWEREKGNPDPAPEWVSSSFPFHLQQKRTWDQRLHTPEERTWNQRLEKGPGTRDWGTCPCGQTERQTPVKTLPSHHTMCAGSNQGSSVQC